MSTTTPTARTTGEILEQLNQAALARARAQADDSTDPAAATKAYSTVVAQAVADGISVMEIARIERQANRQAAKQLGPGLLRTVAQAAKRKHEADDTYTTAIVKAGRLLSAKQIAQAAETTVGQIRTITNNQARPTAERETSEPQQPADADTQPQA